MPTDVNHSRRSTSRRVDVTPTSLAPLAIIAILILVLHVAGSTLLAGPQAHASAVATDAHANCQDATLPQPSLPFD